MTDRVRAEAPNKHQQKTIATKRKLLRAAFRIFARDGFEAARIDSIAREAGHTRGAFYAHFKTKEDLFFALLRDQSQGHMDQLKKLLEACNNELERRTALREFYANRAADRQWSILVVEFKLYALRHPKLRPKLASAFRSIRSQMKLEEIHSVLPARMQVQSLSNDLKRITLSVMLNGLALENAYDPDSVSKDQVPVLLRQFFDLTISAPNWGQEDLT